MPPDDNRLVLVRREHGLAALGLTGREGVRARASTRTNADQPHRRMLRRGLEYVGATESEDSREFRDHNVPVEAKRGTLYEVWVERIWSRRSG
jgi:hypothetical protein